MSSVIIIIDIPSDTLKCTDISLKHQITISAGVENSADCGSDDDGSDDGGDDGIPARVTNDIIYPTTDETYPTTDINYPTVGKFFAVSERYVNKFSPMSCDNIDR